MELPLSGISIPANGTALFGVKCRFRDNPWAEHRSLDRRDGRKYIFRFLVGKESIKHCSPIALPLFLKGKKYIFLESLWFVVQIYYTLH